ncbi:MAG: iron ABC transporter permease [Pseudomonadota bacterium]
MKRIAWEIPVDGRRRLRLGSLRMRVHNLTVAALLAASLIIVALTSLGSGTTVLTLTDVVTALIGQGTPMTEFAIWQVRMPRILLAILAGFAVAMSGAILQTIARNPLADPGLLGLSQGAIVAAMILAVAVPDLAMGWRALGATSGALATGILILTLVGPSQAAGLSILLMGIAVETTLSAISTMLLVHTPLEVSYQLAAWMAGTMDRASWQLLAGYTPWVALVAPLLLLAGPSLRAYDLGDDLARAIGTPTGLRRAAILLATIALAGATTAAVGPLLFLGIMGPHLAGFLSPATGATRLWLSGLMGAILVVAADFAVRMLGPVMPLQLGLSLVLIGVPLFIMTLRLTARRRR